MSSTVTDDPERDRYEITYAGEVAGRLEYHRHRDVIALLYTEVDSRFSGRGLAGALVRHVLTEARDNGDRVEPFCGFVRGYIAKHPEFAELVAAAQRERFGL